MARGPSKKLRALLFLLCAGAAGRAAGQTADNNGGLSYSLPIKVPAGTSGMGPAISLDYNSMMGNGVAGVGWSFSFLSTITRDPSYPIRFDGNDHFMFNGQKLILAADNTYHTEKESFVRFEFDRQNESNRSGWKVTDKNGVVKFFSGVPAMGRGLEPPNVMWTLSQVMDPLGNYYDIYYDIDRDNGDYYPAKIVYTKNGMTGKAYAAYRAVLFSYEARPDHAARYIPTKIDVDRRLKWITVKTGTDVAGNGGLLLRKYRFDYVQGVSGRSELTAATEYGSAGNVPPSPSVDASYVPTGTALPSVQIGYTGLNSGVELSSGISVRLGSTGPEGNSDMQRMRFGDFNGDGRTDIYYITGQPGLNTNDLLYLAQTDGTFSRVDSGIPSAVGHYEQTLVTPIGEATTAVDMTRYVFGDFNGDGTTDVYVIRDMVRDPVYLMSRYGSSQAMFVGPQLGVIPRSILDPNDHQTLRADLNYIARRISRVRTGDFDGDGRTDVYVVGGSNAGDNAADGIYLAGGTASALTFPAEPSFGGITHTLLGNFETELARIKFGDFDGDGKTDVYFVNGFNGPGEPEFTDFVWASNGDGTYRALAGIKHTTPLSNTVPFIGSMDAKMHANRYRIADFNGDGRSDVYLTQLGFDTQTVVDDLFVTDGGGQWARQPGASHPGPVPFNFPNTPVVMAHFSRLQLGEFNGDGRPDVYIFARGTQDTIYLDAADGTWPSLPGKSHPAPTQWDRDVQRISFGDFNGDGKTDVYYRDGWITNASTETLLLTNSNPAELLFSIRNGRGADTAVGYIPAPQMPGALNATAPTFPMVSNMSARPLVLRIVTNDGVGGSSSTKYSYYDGRYVSGDVRTRRNLGFARMRTTDESTGAYVETSFYQTYPLEGIASKTETFDTTGRLYLRNEFLYDAVDLGGGIRFVRKSWDGVTNFNGGSTAGTVRWTMYASYDAHGNCTGIVDQGLQDNPYDSVGTYLTFAYNPLTNASKVAVRETWGFTVDHVWTRATLTRTFYDASTTLGTMTSGLATSVESTVDGTQFIPTFYSYDAWGNVISVWDGRSGGGEYGGPGSKPITSAFTYDVRYHLLLESTTDVLGRITTYQHTDGLLRTGVTDPNGVRTTTLFDDYGNVSATVAPDDTVLSPTMQTIVDYSDVSAPTCVITRAKTKNGEAALDRYTYYDGLGRVIQVKTPTADPAVWRVVDTWYDASGRAVRTSVPYTTNTGTPSATTTTRVNPFTSGVKYTTTSYDVAGRPSVITKPDDTTQRSIYEPRITYRIDELNHTTATWFDNAGEHNTEYRGVYPNISTYADTKTETGAGSTRITDARGNVTLVTFDRLGRKTSQTDPDMGTWQWTYDGNGNKVSERDARGALTTYTYDRLNRLKRVSYPNDPAVVYHYDGDNDDNGTLEVPGAIGRLTKIEYGAFGAKWFAYDSRGRVTSTTVMIDGQLRTELVTEYDAMDRTRTASMPDGEVMSNTFDGGGQLRALAGTNNYATSILYDAYGAMTEINYGNGEKRTYGYDFNSHRLRSITTTPNVMSLSYDYDARGNVTRKSNNTGFSEGYVYDELDRLTMVSPLGGTSSTAFYDEIGNVSQRDGNMYTYGDTRHPHAVTAAGGATYAYDLNGNMTSRSAPGATFTYDDAHRMVASPGATYAYFGEGRVKKTEGGATTRYFFADFEETTSATGTVTATKYYFANGQRIAQRSAASGLQYLHGDLLGSTSVVTSGTTAGTVVRTTQYDGWGRQVSATGSAPARYTFTGKELDASGLYYFGARYYDPALGRFISPDTLVPSGTPQRLNRYTYANNNPVSLVDPNGHDVLDDAFNQLGWGVAGTIWNGIKSFTNANLALGSFVMSDVLGISSINAGLYYGVGGEISLNLEDNSIAFGAGVGYGAYGTLTHASGATIGGACGVHIAMGYDTGARSLYLSGAGTFSVGIVGYSQSHMYYFASRDYMSTYTGSLLYFSVGRSFSSRGIGPITWGISSPQVGGVGYRLEYDVKNGFKGQVTVAMCFVAGTKVETKDGPKNIEDIVIGDVVRSMDDKTGEMGWKPVVNTFVNHTESIARVLVLGPAGDGGEIIESTPGHRFWVVEGDGGRWLHADDLVPGMKLRSTDGSLRTVGDVSVVARAVPVYNFEVADWHTYLVGAEKVVVHNQMCTKECPTDDCDGGEGQALQPAGTGGTSGATGRSHFGHVSVSDPKLAVHAAATAMEAAESGSALGSTAEALGKGVAPALALFSAGLDMAEGAERLESGDTAGAMRSFVSGGASWGSVAFRSPVLGFVGMGVYMFERMGDPENVALGRAHDAIQNQGTDTQGGQ